MSYEWRDKNAKLLNIISNTEYAAFQIVKTPILFIHIDFSFFGAHKKTSCKFLLYRFTENSNERKVKKVKEYNDITLVRHNGKTY